MGVNFEYRPSDNSAVIGNVAPGCSSCARDCPNVSVVKKCDCTGNRRRRVLKEIDGGKLYVCSDESIKSTRIFYEKVRAIEDVLPFVAKTREEATRDASVHVHRLVHNLITLNAQTIQAIYRLVPQDDFYQKDRDDLVRVVSQRLSDSQKTAGLVIDLLKNANLEKTEYAGYMKLLEQDPVDCRFYAIHKIFMLILNTYWDALKEKDVFVQVGTCQEKIYVDYDTIAASLVHLLSNTVKYILPGSKLRVHFQERRDSIVLSLDMVSFRIRPEEIDAVMQEGCSGEEPRKLGLQGDGIGLYLVRRLLWLSHATVSIRRDVNKDQSVHRLGVQFENNVFEVWLPRSKLR